MSKEQREMMDSEDKLVGESGNPLTYLFRMVLGIKELKVNSSNWNARLTRFLNSPWSRVPKNSKDIGQERNNFNRAIAKAEVTFRTFQKAIQILGPVRYSMSIRMEMRGGKVFEVTTPMFKNPYADIDLLQNAFVPPSQSVSENDIDDYEREEEAIATAEDLQETMDAIPDYMEDRPVFTRPNRHRGDEVLRASLGDDEHD